MEHLKVILVLVHTTVEPIAGRNAEPSKRFLGAKFHGFRGVHIMIPRRVNMETVTVQVALVPAAQAMRTNAS